MDLVQSYWWVSGSGRPDPHSAEGSSAWGMTAPILDFSIIFFLFYILEAVLGVSFIFMWKC